MTTWIGTNQAGWDANDIGFHSIQGCTGLVLMAGTNKVRIIHNGHDDWKTEVEDFAGIFGYQGTTKGLNIRSKVGANDSCDIVITKVLDDCQIRYKRTGKMTHTQQTNAQQLASPVRTIYKNGALAASQLIAGPESHSAAVVVTDSNEGEMHHASWWSMSSHTV